MDMAVYTGLGKGESRRMRTVFLVTRHTDLSRFGAELDSRGFSVPVVAPEQLASDEVGVRADVVVLDLRDIPPAAFNVLCANYAQENTILVTVVPTGGIDRVTADMAIDDFVMLDCPPEELVRRIERALWSKHGVDSENNVRCGALAIDLSNYRVTVDEEPLVLTFKEYELLRFLAMNSGRVFTREQLLNRVWGYDYFGGARTVDVHIRRIRAKIEIHGHAFIETVRNVGYRLVAEAKNEG